MIDLSNKVGSRCTGCAACYNGCPFGAIKMISNERGFYVPFVDADLCTECKLCTSVCPVLKHEIDNADDPVCYAIWADDSTRAHSSSGGVFPVLARDFIKRGGVVVGAAFDDYFNVHHIMIDKEDDIIKLQGSKYLQSYVGDIYSQVKQKLRENIDVLFVGTPCQVAAIKSYLKVDYKNLLTAEVICKSVPSPAVWQQYLRELSHGSKVKSVSFRSNRQPWGTGHMLEIKWDDGRVYYGHSDTDSYYYAFGKELAVNSACSDCHFAKLPRVADLTMGDFWGIEQYKSSLVDGKGTSLLLVNNSKGEEVLQQVKTSFKLIEIVDIKHSLKRNPCLKKSFSTHSNANQFFKNVQKYSIDAVVDEIRDNRVQVGIMNFWASGNYGAMLTSYGLQETLCDLGYLAKTIYYWTPWWSKKSFKARGSHNGADERRFVFAEKYLNLTQRVSTWDEFRELNKQIETFVVGSDQVWRPHGAYKNSFYLDFVNPEKKKIAYAVSFGVDKIEGTQEELDYYQYYAQRFTAVSVREDYAVDLCKSVLDVEADFVLDPVFTVDSAKYDKMADSSLLVDGELKDFIVHYTLENRHDIDEYVDNMSKKTNLKVIRMGLGNSVEDWLYYIKNAKYVVTDSFHGTCFAIIFNRPFLSFAHGSVGHYRALSLLRLLSLQSHLITSAEELLNFDWTVSIDYENVNEILKREKERSIQWLKNALEINAKSEPISQRIQYYEMIKRQNKTLNQFDIKSKARRFCQRVKGKLKWEIKRILAKI